MDFGPQQQETHTCGHISSSACTMMWCFHSMFSIVKIKWTWTSFSFITFLLYALFYTHTACARQYLVHLQPLKVKQWALMVFCCPGPCHLILTILTAMSSGNFHLSLDCSYLKEESLLHFVASWKHKYRMKQYLLGLRDILNSLKLHSWNVFGFFFFFPLEVQNTYIAANGTNGLRTSSKWWLLVLFLLCTVQSQLLISYIMQSGKQWPQIWTSFL